MTAEDPGVPAPDRLTVDLGAGTGPIHGGASGTIHGLSGRHGASGRSTACTETACPAGRSSRAGTSARSRRGAGRPPAHPGADALEILPSFVAAGGELPDFDGESRDPHDQRPPTPPSSTG
ncbi:hypothetical protein [Streptomyces sp. ALI-76-A]|uniref:hypothetical protein n=1 Tax=Streptomyces sp. ALI-76-A TaxID=3025736 RepID=UPI003364EEB1